MQVFMPGRGNIMADYRKNTLLSLIHYVPMFCIGLFLIVNTVAVKAQDDPWQTRMDKGLQAAQRRQEAEAEKWYVEALRYMESLGDPGDARLLSTLNTLAVFYHTQGRLAEAEPLYQKVLKTLQQIVGPEHPNLATTMNNLAVLYEAQNDYATAEPLYRRALAILEQALGPEHANVAAALDNYADLLRKAQRPEEAQLLEERARAIWAKHVHKP
jgi:tetratricopeptide (TPR) repeat protein